MHEHAVGFQAPCLAGDLLECHVRRLAVLPDDIAVGLALGHQVDGIGAERAREDAVEGARRTAALHVPEHGDARLGAGLARDDVGDGGADAVADLAVGEGVRDRLARGSRTPSEQTTSAWFCPRVRARRCAATFSMSNGISGMRMTSAPAAMPVAMAIQPTSRPITSSTIVRRWLAAVGCRRSAASTQTSTALM